MHKVIQYSLIFVTLVVLISSAANREASAQMVGLPEGAKARLGKGYKTGSSVFSKDGTRFAIASSIGLWIYDVHTGKEVALIQEHPNDFTVIAFSPDSQTIASGSRDNTIRLWSAKTGQHLATLEQQIAWGVVTHEGHTGDVTAVAFSPDGATLAGGDTHNTVRLWDVAVRQHRAILTGHTDTVTALTFSKDGTMLVSGSRDDTIRLWDTVTERHLATLEGHESDVIVFAFSSDGATLASGDASEIVRLWNGNTGQHLDTLLLGNEVYGYPVRAVTFSPDGVSLASGDGRTIWDEHAYRTSGSCSWFYYRRGGSTLYYGSTRLWDALTRQHRSTLTGHGAFVYAVAFSPDGTILARAGESRSLVVDCRGLTVTTYRTRYTHSLQLWDTNTGEHLADLEGHSGNVSSVAFSRDGNLLASGSWDDTIRLWNPSTGGHLATFTGHGGDVNAVAFSPDGETLASGSDDDTIRLWDSDGRVRATLSEHEDNVTSVVFSPDGSTLASGSVDGTIRLWNPITGDSLAVLEGHTDRVSSVAFSVDGGTLASGSWDDTIRLWDSTTGEPLVTFSGHRGDVNAVAFSPDGVTLASGSNDRTILLWEITPATSQIRLDVNGDGVVNVLDLTLVASRFGQAGENIADVNGDSLVDRQDIIQILDALEPVGAAPSAHSGTIPTLTAEKLQRWIRYAKQLNLSDSTFQSGIAVLEQLLAALTETQAIPAETVLLPNYPNPFNPETWIPYRLAQAAEVTLEIYDATGGLVRRIDVGFKPPAVYESRASAIYWDGRNESGEAVGSGLYFYKMSAGDYSATRKMLIIK